MSAISPYDEARRKARSMVEEHATFICVHVATTLEECIRRDVKGLYKKALAGTIEHFTGVSDPYEPPLMPELVVETDREAPVDSARGIIFCLQSLGYLPASKIEELAPTERLAPIQTGSEA